MSSPAHSHDTEHPLFAQVYDPVMALPERMLLADHRSHLAEGLSGKVIDLGSGTGAMFPHYPGGRDLTVHGVEPDPYMRRQAADRADNLETDIEVVDASGESLPYPDDSFETAVAVFVFCTVQNLEATLDELARVLRPGGELRFLEHVRARGTVGSLHDALAPGWFHVAGGCTLNRQTGDVLARDERFELLEYSRFESGLSRLFPLIRGRLERRRGSWLPV
jgi:ubiquinone/menaquinone biosynthesis C-methylase UbiE